MGFKYACFISYAHGQYDLVKSFIDQLKLALKTELDTFMKEELYIDEERLVPGALYNEALATAICESVCMVVVYSPVYERREYCLREFEAMATLEQERRKLLGASARSVGFIIPVILRGEKDIPDRIKQHKHYVDLSEFSLAGLVDLARHPKYSTEIRKIAEAIYEAYKAFVTSGVDPTTTCATFTLPGATEVAPWRPAFVNR